MNEDDGGTIGSGDGGGGGGGGGVWWTWITQRYVESNLCYASLTLWRIYGEWAYECSSTWIRNDRKWSPDIRGRFCGVSNVMLVSPVANVWRRAYECKSPSIRNDRKVIARHSLMFVSIRGRSCGVANIRNRFLKFARKAYSYCFRTHRNIFLLMARHL